MAQQDAPPKRSKACVASATEVKIEAVKAALQKKYEISLKNLNERLEKASKPAVELPCQLMQRHLAA